MQTDRELIEAAAKACSLPECGWMGPAFMYVKENTFTDWNPLTDDGDALRLAVKLGFRVETGRCWVSAYGPMFGEDVLPCAYAATRRAIVRAAAAMAVTEARRTEHDKTVEPCRGAAPEHRHALARS